MDPPHRIYRGAVRTLSVVFIAIGLAVLATTFANGGGPTSLGILLGLAFVGVGIGRLWLSGRLHS